MILPPLANSYVALVLHNDGFLGPDGPKPKSSSSTTFICAVLLEDRYDPHSLETPEPKLGPHQATGPVASCLKDTRAGQRPIP